MDGTSRMVLHDTSLLAVRCITIDYDHQVLYWADSELNKIESSDVDGSNRRTLTTTFLNVFTIYYHNGMLYWGSRNGTNSRVLTGPATQPDNGIVLQDSFPLDPSNIKVVSIDSQPLG